MASVDCSLTLWAPTRCSGQPHYLDYDTHDSRCTVAVLAYIQCASFKVQVYLWSVQRLT